jgi:hypothetical protein
VIAAALLLAAATPSALDAEHSFAADAKKIGLWTAFRKYADDDAVMFAPQAVWARDFLQDRKDPPKSIGWIATHSFVSCDGSTAINTGPWFAPDGKLNGYFTTVWKHTGEGWRWVYDGGIPKPAKVAAKSGPQVHRASCTPHATGALIGLIAKATSKQPPRTPKDEGRGQSADKTLVWEWKVAPSGERTFRVFQWTAGKYAEVIHAVDPAR